MISTLFSLQRTPQVCELTKHFPDQPALLGDLHTLRNETDPEADFFYNITHVQLHRRQRALKRLRDTMNALPSQLQTYQKAQEVAEGANAAEADTPKSGSGSDGNAFTVSVPSLVNVLVPLVKHFVFENVKAAEKYLQEEATFALAAVAAHLPWREYSALLRALLKQIGRRPELESALVKACCAILDVFPFASLPSQQLVPTMDDGMNWNDISATVKKEKPQSTIEMDVAVDFTKKGGKKSKKSKAKGKVIEMGEKNAMDAAGMGLQKCMYWTGVQGSCSRGDACHFSHDLGSQAGPHQDATGVEEEEVDISSQSMQQREWQAAVKGLQFKMLPMMRSHLFYFTTSKKTGAK